MTPAGRTNTTGDQSMPGSKSPRQRVGVWTQRGKLISVLGLLLALAVTIWMVQADASAADMDWSKAGSYAPASADAAHGKAVVQARCAPATAQTATAAIPNIRSWPARIPTIYMRNSRRSAAGNAVR